MVEEKVVAKPPSILVSLAKAFCEYEVKVEAAEEALSVAKKNRDRTESKLCEQMTTEGISSFRTAMGGFRNQVMCYPNVKDREKLQAYVKKKKLDWLFTVSIHGTKLRSYVTELMQEGREIPPGIDPYLKNVVRRFK